jgi:hypothetical protein
VYAILYILAAFTLLACFFSPDYRDKTTERWKRTPKHRVVTEIGAGIIGLLLLVTIAYFIITAVEDSNQN